MVSEQQANPIGLNGVEFIEYAGNDAHFFESLFEKFHFKKVAQITGKKIYLYVQGNINFILNCEAQTFSGSFAQLHGPSVSATGFRVRDAEHAFQEAVNRGAKPFEGDPNLKGATPFPAIYGIGDSLIYFIDEKGANKLYSTIFGIDRMRESHPGAGFTEIDHFTNNVPRGEMDKWCHFYESVFNFREVRYFDIRGQKTGLLSRALRSPCGKFSVPVNEPTENKSQIQEYLDQYKGSGIQHIAFLTHNILRTIETLKEGQIEFLTPPPGTYYSMLNERVPYVSEEIERLQKNAILVDGDDHGYLLQIFTKNIIGPIFYEVIQRKGHDGFGDGNFQALFDAIERDQKERGYL